MRTSRIILAALAVAAISAQAQGAHRRIPSTLRAPLIDAAAIPAYPFAEGHAAASRAFSHRREAVRTGRHSHHHEITRHEPRLAESGSGIVRSGKTGVSVRVSAQFSGRFQALVDDLEAEGATIYYMGGIRPGRCSLGSQHPCGWAIDICQDYRGHVSGSKDCNLPKPAKFHEIVRAHGLYDGSVWCSTDYGHVQAKDSGGCNMAAHGSWGHGGRYLASMTGSIQIAAERRHHHRRPHHLRYARR